MYLQVYSAREKNKQNLKRNDLFKKKNSIAAGFQRLGQCYLENALEPIQHPLNKPL